MARAAAGSRPAGAARTAFAGGRAWPAGTAAVGRIGTRSRILRYGEAGRWLASRLPAEGLARALGVQSLPDRVLRLDPSLPFGDERDLDLLPNTLPPQRHLGYAVQWFGLALTVLVVALVLEWRRRRAVARPASRTQP